MDWRLAGDPDAPSAPSYWAFISYSHIDRRWADWLHRSLESYRIPRHLADGRQDGSGVPAHLRPIFLDRAELSPSDNLEKDIAEALARSRALIVVCSPAAVHSRRVAQEIETFRRLGRGPILPIIVAGRPNALARGLDARDECFPASLTNDRANSRPTPLAADARARRGGRQEARLKLVSGLLGVNLDRLRQRELARRRTRWSIALGTALLGLLAASAVALYAVRQRDAAIGAELRLLTQSALERRQSDDFTSAQGLMLEVLSPHGGQREDPATYAAMREIDSADPAEAVFAGHRDRVLAAAFSPDGKRLLTASFDHSARVWDADSGAELLVLAGHADSLSDAAWSPVGDVVATASADGTARLWHATSGVLQASLVAHSRRLSHVEFSADGARVLTASDDGSARVWETSSGRLLLTLAAHQKRVEIARFSPDDTRILTASEDHTARLWNAQTGAPLAVLRGHEDALSGAVFSPDGSRIATVSADRTARLWDGRSGRPIAQLRGHTGVVRAVAFSPNGTQLATVSQDGTGRLWDVASATPGPVLSGHQSWVIRVSYSPSGNELVTTSADETARVWNARTGQVISVLKGHHDHVIGAVFSPDGKHIATSGEEGTARLWATYPGHPVAVLPTHDGYASSPIYTPDGAAVVTADDGGRVRTWDAASGELRSQFQGHTRRINALAISPDGQQIVTAARDVDALRWSRDGQRLGALVGHQKSVEDVDFSPDGTRILTASQDHTAKLWDSTSGALLATLAGHTDRATSARFSPRGDRIVTASFDRTARLWSASGQSQGILVGHSQIVSSAAFSPDGHHVVTASEDGTAIIWDASRLSPVRTLAGHREGLTYAAYSHDGRRIATASLDRTVRVWDADTGALLDVLAGHSQIVTSVRFSPDDQFLLSASDDATARIWHVRPTRPIESQVLAYARAQFEPLPKAQRLQLGLGVTAAAFAQSAAASECDRQAAAPYDRKRRAAGIDAEAMDWNAAVTACESEVQAHRSSQTAIYQLGRAYAAKGDLIKARTMLEQAYGGGYRASQVDLALLLLGPSAVSADRQRAIQLLETAWQQGESVSAYYLGRSQPQDEDDPVPGPASWYQRGLAAHDAESAAALANESARRAFAASAAQTRRELLQQALEFYSDALRFGRDSGWPENRLQLWRYRGASVARALARAPLAD